MKGEDDQKPPRHSSTRAQNETLLNATDDSDSNEDVVDHDRSVLREEEEREQLLSKDTPVERLQKVFGGRSNDGGPLKIGRKERRRQKRREKRDVRRKRRKGQDAEGQLMFEMEEGGLMDSASEASTSSLDLHSQNLGGLLDKRSVGTWLLSFEAYTN